jgi:hypothetical protein
MSTYKALLNEQSVDADSINAHDITTDTLVVADSVSLTALAPESLLMTDPSSTVTTLTLNDGQIPIGATSGLPQAATLTGTTNQVNVTNGAGSITLSTPQDIATTSTPQFVSLKVTDPGPYSVLRLDASNVVQGNYLTDGQLLIGASNHAPYSQTLTAGANVTITNGAGTITIATSPATVFSSITDTGLTANTLVGADGTKTLQSMTLASNNGVAQSVASGVLTTDTPQDLQTSASPSFANVTATNQISGKGVSAGTSGISTSSSISGGTLSATATSSQLNCGGVGAQTHCTFPVPAGNITLTFPNTADTMVGRATTDTLTNKTLTSPVISTITNTGTLTLPTSSDTLVGRDTTDTLTNKTLGATTVTGTITMSSLSASLPLKTNASKQVITSAVNLASSEVTGILPVANLGISAGSGVAISGGGVISAGGSSTFTDITLTNNTNQIAMGSTHTCTLSAPVASQAGNITLTLPTATDTMVGRATTDTLTNKTLTAPVISTITNTGTLTLPTSTDTLVGKATTDTLTNKALTAPVISTITNSGTLTMPTGTRTIVGRDTTDVLKNKNLDSSCVFSLNTDNTRTVTIVPLNANSTNQNLWFNSTVARSYFFADPGADATVVVTEGAQTINGIKTFGTSIKLPTSGGTASALDYYEDWTASGATIGNCVTATACNPRIVRVGKKCTIYFPGLALTSATSTNTMTTTALPSRFFPANSNLRFLCSVINNNVYLTGHIEVSSSTGVITVYSDLNAGTFTNATFVACHPTSFSYLVA